MSDNTAEAVPFEKLADQPIVIKNLSYPERDKLIISTIEIDGQWVILSRYGDNIWKLYGFPNNVTATRRTINFDSIPLTFQPVMKEIVYRYIRRGLIRSTRPRGGTIVNFFEKTKHFLRHIETLGIASLNAVTPEIASSYIAACKEYKTRHTDKHLSTSELLGRYISVEAIYELSQYTEQPMFQHPWPDTTARAIAGLIGAPRVAKTPLIPDDVFCSIFTEAHRQIEFSKIILDLRDELDAIKAKWKGRSIQGLNKAQSKHLKTKKWQGGVLRLNRSLHNLRTACYIILASTSGCRNHELANLQLGAHCRTESDDGTIYHWMRSRSEKTGAGFIKWMIPEVGVRALRIMERWSAPHREMIALEIAKLARIDRHHPQIGEATKHRNSLFLALYRTQGNRVRTIGSTGWTRILREFAKDCGFNWNLASHQFRRKFANYAARSQFGDLRYLKEHFAHWSLDMTLGYAMDDDWGQHLDLDLYGEIRQELADIKVHTVHNWMEDQQLAGGYGMAIKKWQREPENLLIFPDPAAMIRSIAESTAIRSNGHAWCTADNAGCVGNTTERTRCGDTCAHSVIGRSHSPVYQHLYNDLKELKNCQDIGEVGRKRVERDLDRCRKVLSQLGMPPDDLIP